MPEPANVQDIPTSLGDGGSGDCFGCCLGCSAGFGFGGGGGAASFFGASAFFSSFGGGAASCAQCMAVAKAISFDSPEESQLVRL